MSYRTRLALLVLAMLLTLALICVFIALELFLLAGTALAVFAIGGVLFWVNESSRPLAVVQKDEQ